LMAQLETLQRDGYAVARDELEVGLTALAAPVRNLHGEICGSVSISGASFRFPEERVAEFVTLLRDAAGDISARMGWMPERCPGESGNGRTEPLAHPGPVRYACCLLRSVFRNAQLVHL